MIKELIMIFNIAFKLSSINVEKSRRDGALLTVDFNLRTRGTLYARTSPAGTVLSGFGLSYSVNQLFNNSFVSSLRDFGGRVFCLFRRLKPPVNKVPSLRDFFTDITPLQVVYFSSLSKNGYESLSGKMQNIFKLSYQNNFGKEIYFPTKTTVYNNLIN